MSRLLLTLLVLSTGLSGIGCMGDPDLGAVSEAIRLRAPIERIEWEHAPAGCELAPAFDARIHPCVGEPMLGALVGPSGRVLCVDAISAISEPGSGDEEARLEVEGVDWDPTPTPLTPVTEVVY